MWRALFLAFLVAGCVQMPPTPADLQAKRFEPVADKSVIYVVRPPLDSDHPGVLSIDGVLQVATMPGTYHRVEVAPGNHLIEGIIPPSVRMVIDTQPGQIYFLRLDIRGTSRGGPTVVSLQRASPEQGRRLVAQAQLYP